MCDPVLIKSPLLASSTSPWGHGGSWKYNTHPPSLSPLGLQDPSDSSQTGLWKEIFSILPTAAAVSAVQWPPLSVWGFPVLLHGMCLKLFTHIRFGYCWILLTLVYLKEVLHKTVVRNQEYVGLHETEAMSEIHFYHSKKHFLPESMFNTEQLIFFSFLLLLPKS